MALKKFDDIKNEKVEKEKDRKDFIAWLYKKTLFKKSKIEDSWFDDGDCYYNRLEIELNKVIYHWQETSEYNSAEYTFEEFKDAYNKNTLK